MRTHAHYIAADRIVAGMRLTMLSFARWYIRDDFSDFQRPS